MNTLSRTGLLLAPEQFRMSRLQVYNWGTFSGVHDIPVSSRGFLFVGRSGAGKSTLLDAFSALLIPPQWVDFNAAAREAEKTGRDRNLVSYVRGAWAEQKDGESGEIATRYLRTGTTWSALALSYCNDAGQRVVLVRLLWVRGNANGTGDVKPHFLIFERDFDLRELEEFSKWNFDVRKLKQTFPEAVSHDKFRPYCERFCRMLGIESEMALRLLHKTQSAKNLGDLNIFLRDFMLDKPETFEVADRLVSEFGELNAAHQAVVIAREQVQTLAPARDLYQQMQTLQLEHSSLEELRIGLNQYEQMLRINLLGKHIADLRIEAQGHQGEHDKLQAVLKNHNAGLQDLERRHGELGGDQIQQWRMDLGAQELQRDERLFKRRQVDEACRKLGWTLCTTPQGFAEQVGEAREEAERWESGNAGSRDLHIQLDGKKKETESTFERVRREVHALLRQPSNIPADMLDLREKIASAIGVAVDALPFVGELIEVKPEEAAWQGAIERVLHGFALSLLVGERHYAALSNHLNNTHLGKRLVYYRTGKVESSLTRPSGVESLFLKLNVKNGTQADWLRTELQQRFNYSCVDSVQAFRGAERALTREGQIKHSKIRHEKDDRRNINDRRHWVLGFDNRDKLALYQQQAQELADEIAGLDAKISALLEQDKTQRMRAIVCQTFVNVRWQEIDVAPLLERISMIERQIKETLSGNVALEGVAEQIAQLKDRIKQTSETLLNARVALETAQKQIRMDEERLQALQCDMPAVSLTPDQQRGLKELYNALSDFVNLDNLDRVTRSVDKKLGDEQSIVAQSIAERKNGIERSFDDFKRRWPMDAGDLDTSLLSAPDFFAKLARLESDGLPAHEYRFFELLRNQSHQNLAALSTYMNDARKAILERMDLVNESLDQVPFNQSTSQKTFLRIEANDRQLSDVREFKQQIQEVLLHAWSDDREFAESRFIELRKLVERLSSQDPEQKRWRDAVLDVRQHVEFIGREIDEEGIEVEIYRSGAGKSGGQRQKLATTCLAAALRYQLGGSDHGVPMYAPVILDEAFDKADNEFTALAMNIFTNFGFQMIVATPLKSVMTLEPFIGGACFVDISDRKTSSVLLIEYDDGHQKLKLPAHVREEAEVETP
ncbi:ATP-binding protein [Pseudomonas sp. CFII68]|uniref:ATP-binding protein n=1 Tax=Pseudomonas sp. CFII68 TaxID=911243 RepID=UPI0003553CD1|nr:ATP-binding protein [Pseudomonas sp. CFII68]EPJ88289.1 hypothetical protein CFII68_11404 [Pseudomonas sp. CFII68]